MQSDTLARAASQEVGLRANQEYAQSWMGGQADEEEGEKTSPGTSPERRGSSTAGSGDSQEPKMVAADQGSTPDT